jgi:hypothetical protein
VRISAAQPRFITSLAYAAQPMPMINIDTIVESSNRTNVTLRFTSATFGTRIEYKVQMTDAQTVNVNVRLPANDVHMVEVNITRADELRVRAPGFIPIYYHIFMLTYQYHVQPSNELRVPATQPLLNDGLLMLRVQIEQRFRGTPVLAQFWCGFGGEYCGQSKGDDVCRWCLWII